MQQLLQATGLSIWIHWRLCVNVNEFVYTKIGTLLWDQNISRIFNESWYDGVSYSLVKVSSRVILV